MDGDMGEKTATVDLKAEYESSGVREILDELDRELIGLAPVKERIRETAALLLVDRARRDLSGWNETSLGMAIMAAAQADADVKGASRDPVFSLERLVTVIATRAPYGS